MAGMRNGGVMALIYVVEDDKNISEIESFALKNAGHQIVECASGKEFHKQVIERIPDLILLDIMLPDEDGLQILTKMRATPETRRVPVILVTAKTTEIDKVPLCKVIMGDERQGSLTLPRLFMLPSIQSIPVYGFLFHPTKITSWGKNVQEYGVKTIKSVENKYL